MFWYYSTVIPGLPEGFGITLSSKSRRVCVAFVVSYVPSMRFRCGYVYRIRVVMRSQHATSMWLCVYTSHAARAARSFVTGTAATDREALVALWKAANGAFWVNEKGWCTPANLGHWHGVTVNSQGRVVELRLHRNNLQGKADPNADSRSCLPNDHKSVCVFALL